MNKRHAMETIEVNRLFVNEVVVNYKQLKHVKEANIINNVRDELLYVILENNIDEAKERCRCIIEEETNNEPIKGNIIFSVVSADNNTDIEIVRHAHGGGNNSSVRVTGGVVVATLKTVPIKGELSAIHGYKWYHPKDRNPFFYV